MQSAAAALGSVLEFAAEVEETVSRVDRALPPLRRLLAAVGMPFKLVGGLAVVHHGYVRTTRDLDLLLEPAANQLLSDALLAEHGFERLSPRKLRHRGSGVDVDLLLAGEPMPRWGAPRYPSPADLPGSRRDPDFVALPGLVELKLHAARHQDLADVVALLKKVDDFEYLQLEAGLPAGLRIRLGELRRDALEELGWERESRS